MKVVMFMTSMNHLRPSDIFIRRNGRTVENCRSGEQVLRVAVHAPDDRITRQQAESMQTIMHVVHSTGPAQVDLEGDLGREFEWRIHPIHLTRQERLEEEG